MTDGRGRAKARGDRSAGREDGRADDGPRLDARAAVLIAFLQPRIRPLAPLFERARGERARFAIRDVRSAAEVWYGSVMGRTSSSHRPVHARTWPVSTSRTDLATAQMRTRGSLLSSGSVSVGLSARRCTPRRARHVPRVTLRNSRPIGGSGVAPARARKPLAHAAPPGGLLRSAVRNTRGGKSRLRMKEDAPLQAPRCARWVPTRYRSEVQVRQAALVPQGRDAARRGV
ncbi:hypothetical protein BD413DRAFT_560746 [Trametes elegans]|nr:hypothetical protein BD413DRAFT_560746 [Trametes elegans]